jgi:IclR family acetate operon transcriptional repressor
MREEPYVVRSIIRAADLLELVRSAEGEGISLRDLARQAGLPKPSVFRIMRTLESVSLVERISGSDRFKVGIRCFELGHAYLHQTSLKAEALPILKRLVAATRETVHLAVLDDEFRVVYLEKLDSPRAVGIMMSRVGGTAPAHCTGLGKAMLACLDDEGLRAMAERGLLKRYTRNTITDLEVLKAELDEIRGKGFALDREEHEVGVRCVAAWVARREGEPPAAISIAGPANRLPEGKLRGQLADRVVDASHELSHRLGGLAHPGA